MVEPQTKADTSPLKRERKETVPVPKYRAMYVYYIYIESIRAVHQMSFLKIKTKL